MNSKVEKAVARLNKILPLAERQKKLNPEVADVYQKILHSYVELGRSLTKAEISQLIDNADEVIDILRENDMVVFDSKNEPVGVYPFTMEQREHKISINGHTVHSMCALDVLAISPMFNQQAHIDSRCSVSGEKISIDQLDQQIINREENKDLHFGINWNSAANNCCATSLCTEMIFLKNKKIANDWLMEDKDNREIFGLDEAVTFASAFFKPLLA